MRGRNRERGKGVRRLITGNGAEHTNTGFTVCTTTAANTKTNCGCNGVRIVAMMQPPLSSGYCYHRKRQFHWWHPNGVGVTGLNGYRPARRLPPRTTIILLEPWCIKRHHNPEMGVPELRRKKRRTARLVSPLVSRNANSGCRFCDSGKTIPETAKRSKPEKGAEC